MKYFEINCFPDYRLVMENDRDFYVESKQFGSWERIGSDDGMGHIRMHIFNNGVKKHTSVHAIVAELFVPNPENKPIVHHIDFDPSNNNPSNLMWVTQSEHRLIHNSGRKTSEETKRKIKSKLIGQNVGENNPMYGKPRAEGAGKQPKQVVQYTKNGEFVAKYKSLSEAERQTGIGYQCISKVCLHKRNYAGGYKWAYLD